MKGWIRQHAVAVASALVVILVLLMVVVMVQAAMLRSDGWTIPLGNVAEWVGGLGALATVLTLLVAWRVYRHDVDSRREETEHRESAERRIQAENITAWLSTQSAQEGRWFPTGQQEVRSTVETHILNASPSVIYDLIVVTAGKHQAHGPVLINTEGGGTRFVMTEWEPSRDRLASGRTRAVAPGTWTTKVKLSHPGVWAEEIHMFFRDYRGVYWWRDGTGQLTEQLPPPSGPLDDAGRLLQIAAALGEESMTITDHLALNPWQPPRHVDFPKMG